MAFNKKILRIPKDYTIDLKNFIYNLFIESINNMFKTLNINSYIKKNKFFSALTFIIFSISILIFFFKLFFYFPSYVVWGNYYSPFTKLQLYRNSNLIFLNINGTPNIFPSSTIFNIFFSSGIITFITYFFSLGVSIRIYFFVSSLFLMYSFYILSSKFSNLRWIRILATLFFMYNPFQITQLAAGDFLVLFYEGFLLLSIFFMLTAINNRKMFNIYLVISFFFMFLTAGELEFSYLGIPLYIVIFTTEFFILNRPDLKLRTLVSKIILYNIIIILAFLLIYMPIILPAYFGSYISLISHSPIAQPLSEYASFTDSFQGVLFLMPYTYTGEKIGDIATNGLFLNYKILLNAYLDILYIFILFLLIFSIIIRAINSKIYFIAVIVSALLGSGPHSPVKFIPIYLYEHLPGYPLLNTSYYWDWIVIAPLYSIMILIILSKLWSKVKEIKNIKITIIGRLVKSVHRIKKPIAIILVLVIVILLILPIVTQDYYYDNGNGILDRGEYEYNYTSMSDQLCVLEEKEPGGVVFLPPGPEIYKNGTDECNHATFSYANYMSFRELQIPSYGSAPSNDTAINCYFYNLLYSDSGVNNKINLGLIMAYLDMKYIVILKNMTQYGNSGYNYLNLHMNKFEGIQIKDNSKNYEIYSSLFKPVSVLYANSFSIDIGNFYSLNALEANNYDINHVIQIYSNNINYNDFWFYFNNTSDIELQNMTYLDYIYLASTNYKTINPTEYVIQNYSAHFPRYHWGNGSYYHPPEVSELPTSPNDYALTCSEFNNLSFKLDGSDTYNKAFVQVYFSNVAPDANMSIFLDNNLIQTINPHIDNSSQNGFILVPINYDINKNMTLTINSGNTSNGPIPDWWIDAIGNIYLTNSSQYISNENIINNIINQQNIHIYSYSNASEMNSNLTYSLGNITLTNQGYSTQSSGFKFAMVNYPLYSNEKSDLKMVGNGIDTIIIENHINKNIHVYITSYKFWLYGTFIQFTFLIALISLMFVLRYKHKYR
jgi:hypothetical protein